MEKAMISVLDITWDQRALGRYWDSACEGDETTWARVAGTRNQNAWPSHSQIGTVWLRLPEWLWPRAQGGRCGDIIDLMTIEVKEEQCMWHSGMVKLWHQEQDGGLATYQLARQWNSIEVRINPTRWQVEYNVSRDHSIQGESENKGQAQKWKNGAMRGLVEN